MAEVMFLLWSNKHSMWWRADACGYTDDIAKAGRYTQDAAVRHVVASAYHGLVGQVTFMIVAPPERCGYSCDGFELADISCPVHGINAPADDRLTRCRAPQSPGCIHPPMYYVSYHDPVVGVIYGDGPRIPATTYRRVCGWCVDGVPDLLTREPIPGGCVMAAVIDEQGNPQTWTAVYWRYHVRYEVESESLEDALGFLRNGEYEGDLSAEEIQGPDGVAVVSKGEIFDAVYGYGKWADGPARAQTIREIGGAS